MNSIFILVKTGFLDLKNQFGTEKTFPVSENPIQETKKTSFVVDKTKPCGGGGRGGSGGT